jgi:hypothetical protein
VENGSEDQGFTFVDKRRVAQDADAAPAGPEPSAAADDASAPVAPNSGLDANGADDASTPGEEPHTHPRLRPADRVLMSIDILHQGAWIALGLVTDPASGSIERDLGEARMLIDCVKALADQVQDHLDDQMQREIKSLVGNLQLNYVNQMRR